MRKLPKVGIFASLVLSGLMLAGTLVARDEIVFDAPYGRVTFNHRKHSEIPNILCVRCHQTWRRNETGGKKCFECHKASEEGKMVSLKDAFYITCNDCHEETRRANKPSGPTMCTQCHVK